MPATSDPPAADRLVVLHGFTQTHHHGHRIAHAIAGRRAERGRRPTLVLPDLPGHGLSAHDGGGIDDAAAELAAITGPATFVGYSMGGRVALHVALLDESPVERLVLIGATAGLDDEAERIGRRRLDDDRARRIEAIGVERFIDEWLDAPLFATLPRQLADVEHRRRNTAAGLAHSLRTAGTGAQASLWDRLGAIRVPTLVIAGELDTKFREIGERLVAGLPQGELAVVDGAGHAAHTERSDQVAALVDGWWASSER